MDAAPPPPLHPPSSTSSNRPEAPAPGIGETTSVPPRTCRDAAPVCHGEHVDAMLTTPPSVRLRGRDTELQVLGAALDGARARCGTSLLLTGGPGTGRTALLDHVRSDADDFTALSTAGVADEADVPLSGLQRLLTPIEAAVDLLAEPRRGRMREALVRGNPGDRFGLGTGVLDLLARAAEERPLLLTVDDADLLDRDSLDALAFVARRLDSTRIALVMASRAATARRASGGSSRPLVPGIDEHVLAPLGTGPVHDVLTAAAPVTLA
ncbi:ATP-binding protein, partial [Nocardiopsis salina]|uniref:ATP-binding protein n=1 Tax=Nocardiopsis salina TaxID=245836 RepID=UPI001EF9EAD9